MPFVGPGWITGKKIKKVNKMIKSNQEPIRKKYQGFCEKCKQWTYRLKQNPIVKCQACGYWHEEIDESIVICENCLNTEYKQNIRGLELLDD